MELHGKKNNDLMKLFLEKKQGWNEQFRPFALVSDVPPKGYNLKDHFVIGTFKMMQDLEISWQAKRLDKLSDFEWSNYASHFGDNLLNNQYCLLPAREIKRLKYQILGQFGDDCKIFVRPNSGAKPFDGQILDITEFAYFGSMYENELTVISKPQSIIGEWRFMVTQGGDILGLSLYRYQGNHVEVESCPPDMQNFVIDVVKNIKINIAPLFVVDVAQTSNMKYKIIEINSAHHSGLYAMKPKPIVEFIKNL